jgi:hypothetical protein
MNMNTTVAPAPSTPAATRTASAPNAAASGPTTKNDTGAPRIVIIQSSDETRPSRSLGTSRCIAVNQITTNTAIVDSAMNDTTIACGTLTTIPKNVVMPIPIAQQVYIRVRGRRGRPPRCAITSEAMTEPTPPAANTRPSWNSVPCISLRTTYGTSVSHGPQTANRLTIPPRSPHLSHRVLRTYARPSRTSAHSCVPSSSALRSERTCISQMQTAETANVSASTMNAHPVPAVATSDAPISGPITSHASGRTVDPIELASTRCSSGTIVGMIELNAGQKIA